MTVQEFFASIEINGHWKLTILDKSSMCLDVVDSENQKWPDLIKRYHTAKLSYIAIHHEEYEILRNFVYLEATI